MVFCQTRIFLVLLLLAFSGLNLIRSDCGADDDDDGGVNRLNNDGFCANTDSKRHINDNYNNYIKDHERRQFRDLERRGTFFLRFSSVFV